MDNKKKYVKKIRCELYNDNFQNYKKYHIPKKAQLVISDIPYNLGKNAFASSPEWYVDGDNKKGESKKANSNFFKTDINFNLAEYMHFWVYWFRIRLPLEPIFDHFTVIIEFR